jgi:hypothetical protein
VGKIGVTDADTADTHTFELSDPRFEVREGNLYLKAGEALDADAEPFLAVRITATDSGAPPESVSRDVGITVLPRPADWDHGYQWRPSALDVNVDGIISPLDALMVINELNAFGSRNLPSLAGGTLPGPFFDTSGDDLISPLDALLVIIHLNDVSAGESESPPPAAAHDAALASLMADELASASSASKGSGDDDTDLWPSLDDAG